MEALQAQWPCYAIALTAELDAAFARMLPVQKHRVAGSFDDTQSAMDTNRDRLIVAMIGRDLEPLRGLQVEEMIAHVLKAGGWRYIIADIPKPLIDDYAERVVAGGEPADEAIVGMMFLWIQPEEES